MVSADPFTERQQQ